MICIFVCVCVLFVTLLATLGKISKKAMECHPDKNPDDQEAAAETFRQLVEAFQVLSGGYKKGKYEKEYQMLQRLQKRQQQQTSKVEEEEVAVPRMGDDFIISEKLSTILPPHLYKTLVQRTNTEEPSLLPIQESSYKAILMGEDVVLNAPSGSGKTLAYILPLLARLPEKDEDPDEELIILEQKRGRRRRRNRRSHNSDDKQSRPCKPLNLILVPSKEVAKRVGKLCSQYHQSSKDVVTIFGKQQQSHLLSNKDLDTIVGTPIRIHELVKEGALDFSKLQTVVLDEADVMLNADSKPSVEEILNSIDGDYQTVLSSTTLPTDVTNFCRDTMKLERTGPNFITISADAKDDQDSATTSKEELTEDFSVDKEESNVHHWHITTRTTNRCSLAFDILGTFNPDLCVMFVASQTEVEAVVNSLSFSKQIQTNMLHKGMSELAQSETLEILRGTTNNTSTSKCRLLVTTDDMSIDELDFPGVDLVLQFGIPRQSGNHELYDANVYKNRTKHAGQFGEDSTKEADVILLYDYEDEGRLLPGLQTELEVDWGLVLKPREPPSKQDVFETPYQRAKEVCTSFPPKALIVDTFREKVEKDMLEIAHSGREEELVRRLAIALAALADQD